MTPPLPFLARIQSEIPAILSVLGAVTAWQEQLSWAVQILGGVIAIVAGGLAIYRHFVPKRKSPGG